VPLRLKSYVYRYWYNRRGYETENKEGSWRVGGGGGNVQVAIRLFGLLLEEGDQVVTVLGLLETAKGHLGAGNVLLGVLEVVKLSYC
jgi:hypothetical protein